MQIIHESIFSSALRTFARIFSAIFGLLLAILIFSLLYTSVAPSPLLESNTEMVLLADAKNQRKLGSANSPVILQIPIHGVIGDPRNINTEMIETILLDSREFALTGNRVKGILLHFNTPGGAATDSDSIYRMLKTYKEQYNIPVFGYVEGLCASGGMYIASATDKIFAGPASTIGSVGVLMGPFLNFADAMSRVGIQAKTITQGLDKDMMNPTRNWKPGEDNSIQAVTAFMYQEFVNVVTSARPRLDRDRLIEEYGAQVFDCVSAERLGYIDVAMSSRNEALLALLQEAQIDPASPYQVVSLNPKISWASYLLSNKSPLVSGKVEHSLDLKELPFSDQCAYLYKPQ